MVAKISLQLYLITTIIFHALLNNDDIFKNDSFEDEFQTFRFEKE